MKVLILGDPNKYFRLEYVKQMKRYFPDIEFDILSNKKLNISKHSYNNVIQIEYDVGKNFFSRFIKLRRELETINKYDFIHIHSADLIWLLAIDILKQKSKKVILTYYGSDFYRAPMYKKRFFKLYNKMVDYVTFTSEKMMNDVILNSNKKNVQVIKFGISSLAHIDNIRRIGKKKLKSKFGISPNDIVISVGYNAIRAQKHYEVLEIINDIYLNIKNIVVILPLNYGDHNYLEELIRKLSKYRFKIITSDKFLSNEEIAELRYVSDIIIHVQDSDQFSASISEYLYADNILINGDWIKYHEYEKWGVYYKTISNLENLKECLTTVIENYDDEYQKVNARQILKEHLNWENSCYEWRKLYNRLR